jgi:hypothetical protein
VRRRTAFLPGEALREQSGGESAMSTAGATTSASATPIRHCWSWTNGSGEECGCTTGSNGSGPGPAAVICSPWASCPTRCTWPRGVGKGTGG